MSGFFRAEFKVVTRSSIWKTGKEGMSSALSAAAYIDGKEYSLKNVSALDSAAYISGAEISDVNGQHHADYTHKAGVLYSEIVLPDHAPERLKDPEVLWSEVEALEGTRKNAALYNEWIVSLDKHLSAEDRMAVAKEFAEALAKEGMVVHYAIHDEKDGNGNFHIHYMAPTRSILEDGSWRTHKYFPREYQLDENGNRIPLIDKETGEQKRYSNGRRAWKMKPSRYTDAFNDPHVGNVSRWRKAFADIENKYLSEEHQVNPDSYNKQGIDKIPGKHLGKAASMVQKRLEEQIHAMPWDKQVEYAEEIIKELKSDYRSLYYGYGRNKPHRSETADCSDLRKRLCQDMQVVKQYTPKRSYISFDCGTDRLILLVALARILEWILNIVLSQFGVGKIQLVKDPPKEFVRAQTNLLIVYGVGMTKAIENQILQDEYQLKIEQIKALGSEIRSLEDQITKMRESDRDETDRIEDVEAQLEAFRNRITALRSTCTAEGAGSDYSDAVRASERVTRGSRELEKLRRRNKESARQIDEMSGRQRKNKGYRKIL